MKRLKFAVATSIFSKLMMSGVQLLALPIAIKALGVEKYGVFVSLTAVLMWMSLANVGLVPGLTRGIAISVANADRAGEKRYLSSAFFLVSGIAFVLLAFLTIILANVPVTSLFGEGYAGFTNEIRRGLLLLGFLFVLKLMLSIVEAARAGYQEQYVTNLSTAAGNALSMVTLFVVALYWPTIAGMIVAVYGMVVLAQLLNGVHLIGVSRPYLMPRLDHFDLGSTKILFITGLAFFLEYISVFVDRQLSVFIVGHELGPTAAADLAVMLRMLELFFGVIWMFTFPLWPALADAVVRRDISWVRNSYKKAILFSTSYSVAVGVVVALAGQTLVRLWIGPEVVPSGLLQGLIGLYFVLWIWSHVHYIVLIGLGWLWAPAVVLLTESLVMVALAIWFIDWMGSAGLVAALCLSYICFSVWLLPLMLKAAIRRAEQLPQSEG